MSNSLTVLILGANGFIGSHLCEQILAKTDWQIIGFDLHAFNLEALRKQQRLQFKQGNIFTEQAWIEQAVQQADIVLPLIAIANPALYVKEPLRVFELDFEANLAVVRLCVKYNKRVIFPSTSEVYGMCPDLEFDEYKSNFVQGPINKPRWIYSCGKQLMDRLITAYGERDHLPYTLFRPFNFMGPRLDDLHQADEGASRAFTQFVGNIMRGQPIHLVGGGAQRRCYIYIDDAIEAIIKIIENKNDCAAQRIFNIGNPKNDISIRELVHLISTEMARYPQFAEHAKHVQLIDTTATNYFGAGYEDVQLRVPSIAQAQQYLDWHPQTPIAEGVSKTLEYYFGTA
jgi:nucleoside-diphosphate-sugar epimerase